MLITEESHDGVHYVAHNKSYDQVKNHGYFRNFELVYLLTYCPFIILWHLLDVGELEVNKGN